MYRLNFYTGPGVKLRRGCFIPNPYRSESLSNILLAIIINKIKDTYFMRLSMGICVFFAFAVTL